MQSILHESDTEAWRKGVHPIRAVAAEMSRECLLGLTPDELRAARPRGAAGGRLFRSCQKLPMRSCLAPSSLFSARSA